MQDNLPPTTDRTDRPRLATVISRRTFGAAVATLFLGGGCKLFNNGWSHTFGNTDPEKRTAAGLPQVQRMAETVGLEIVFVERPADEPLFQPKKLWEGVDRVGQLSPEMRTRLAANGFQIGHAGVTPNSALETLLGLTSFSSGARAPIDPKKLFGQRVIRPTGGETVIPAGKTVQQLTGVITDDSGRAINFKNAKCVFRVKAERLQDGWAKLEFTPEIHHGKETYRPIATDHGFTGATAQRIHRLYDQRFSMKLNIGEMAVITADRTMPDALASYFFIEGMGHSAVQRLLIVRVADVAKTPALHEPMR